jgi:hypothetical protein
MTHVLFLSNDLMFASRAQAAAHGAGAQVAIQSAASLTAAAVPADCRLAIIDLAAAAQDALPGIVAVVRSGSPTARILAFGPHVDEGLLAAAREAGCDDVWSRGQFHQRLSELMRTVTGSPTSTPS